MSVELADITDQPEHNMGSLQETVYYCKAEDVSTWPTLPNLTGSMAVQAVLSGNLTLKSGKEMKELRLTLDTGNLMSEEQGETDAISYKHTLKIFRSGLSAKSLGFLSITKNTGLVFIVKRPDGQAFMLGSEAFTARRQTGGKSETAETTAGRAGSEITFFSYGNTPVPQYNGTIPVDNPGSGSGN
jgi:hypothetical protein